METQQAGEVVCEVFADAERFETVERQIADGVTFSQIDREARTALRQREGQRRQEPQESDDDPVLLMARAIAALTATRPDSAERLRQAVAGPPAPAPVDELKAAEDVAEGMTALRERT